MNPEILNLGHTLRYLESTAVRLVPGPNGAKDVIALNPLKIFNPGAKIDSHILSITVPENGKFKNGLIGFFKDNRGRRYFMLTNLFHGANLSAKEAAVSFKIRFDDSVNTILRLNRHTGKPERIRLKNHTLKITLPGGTGDLFKYNTGPFVMGPLIE